MQKLSAKWAPKCLKADKKRQRCQSSEQIWNFFGATHMISCLARLVTMNETWLYHYDPEIKQKSMEWGIAAYPAPKYSVCKNPLEKFLPRFFGSRRHPPH